MRCGTSGDAYSTLPDLPLPDKLTSAFPGISQVPVARRARTVIDRDAAGGRSRARAARCTGEACALCGIEPSGAHCGIACGGNGQRQCRSEHKWCMAGRVVSKQTVGVYTVMSRSSGSLNVGAMTTYEQWQWQGRVDTHTVRTSSRVQAAAEVALPAGVVLLPLHGMQASTVSPAEYVPTAHAVQALLSRLPKPASQTARVQT
jgi:hypothetical protein